MCFTFMVKMDVKNKVMNEGLALKSLTSVPEEEVHYLYFSL